MRSSDAAAMPMHGDMQEYTAARQAAELVSQDQSVDHRFVVFDAFINRPTLDLDVYQIAARVLLTTGEAQELVDYWVERDGMEVVNVDDATRYRLKSPPRRSWQQRLGLSRR